MTMALNRRGWLLILALLLAPAWAAGAQGDGTAEFFEAYIDALREGDWEKGAQLMHPEALAQFRGLLGSLADADPSGEMSVTLLDLKDGQKMSDLPPDTLYARFMTTLMQMAPQLEQVLRSTTAHLLGSVREGDTTHVVYRVRMQVSGSSAGKVEVMSLKRHAGQWRALLSADLEEMVGGLLQQIRAAGR